MHLKLETWLDYFVFCIILVKLVFLFSAISHLIITHFTKHPNDTLDEKMVYWKERTEFVFIAMMAVLLIYHFNPRMPKKQINEETSLLFFLFGWILIITSKWGIFIKEAHWYKMIENNL
jgi:hypothetical protein